MITTLRTLAAASLAAAACLLAAGPAGAHAALEDSVPAAGQSVTELPATVSVTLNEPVAEPAYIAVTGPDGARVNAEMVAVDGSTATSEVPSTAVAPGAYTMAFRVVSADGHPVSDEIEFEVTGSSAVPSASPAPSSTAPSTAVTTTTSDDSGNLGSIAVLMGFFVVAMGGLIWIVRAGLRSGDGS